MSQPIQKPKVPVQDFFGQSPILGTLLVVSVLNWFLFFAISIYLHGDALGTYPSIDGFILTSHGRITPVSESVWVFSLFYSGLTIMVTPAIWIAFGVRTFSAQLRYAKLITRFGIPIFIIVWCLGWYSSIGSSFWSSVQDWQKLKRPSTSTQSEHAQSRAAGSKRQTPRPTTQLDGR